MDGPLQVRVPVAVLSADVLQLGVRSRDLGLMGTLHSGLSQLADMLRRATVRLGAGRRGRLQLRDLPSEGHDPRRLGLVELGCHELLAGDGESGLRLGQGDRERAQPGVLGGKERGRKGRGVVIVGRQDSLLVGEELGDEGAVAWDRQAGSV